MENQNEITHLQKQRESFSISHRDERTNLYPTPGVFYQATVKCRQ